jgi:hypothetical protein
MRGSKRTMIEVHRSLRRKDINGSEKTPETVLGITEWRTELRFIMNHDPLRGKGAPESCILLLSSSFRIWRGIGILHLLKSERL